MKRVGKFPTTFFLTKCKPFVALFLITVCSFGTLYITWTYIVRLVGEKGDFTEHVNKEVEDFVPINTGKIGCTITKLKPYGKDVRPFINFTNLVSTVKCNKTLYPPIYVVEYAGIPSIYPSNQRQSKYNESDCCYKLISRNMKARNPDIAEEYSKRCYKLTRKKVAIQRKHELLAIFCNATTKTITAKGKKKVKSSPVMVDVFALAPLKDDVESRAFQIAHKNLNSSAFHDPAPDMVNVIVLGLDSMSHMNLQRSMPKLVDYMVKKKGGVGMNGYTRIGDNTYSNIVAVLTSLNQVETNNTCLRKKFFDKCKFLWNLAESIGYRTSYGEDNPIRGIFNYVKEGFYKQPVDYYLRPLMRQAHLKLENGVENMCYGPRFKLDILLNYARALYATMKTDKKFFQFLWSTGLTHDCLNCGAVGEKKILDFFAWFDKKKGFNNSVVVLMSDHGMRYGGIRKTRQGKMEENMPFIYFMFPKWLRKKYSKAMANLKKNVETLTSPYDTYETLKDILQLHTIENDQIKIRTANLEQQWKTKPPRGISMFLQIPTERTCENAEIAETYCTCRNPVALSLDVVDVNQAANFAVFKLNSDIIQYPKCALLDLHSVHNATQLVPKNALQKTKSKIYQIEFKTTPGNATFSATLILSPKKQFTLSGTISRTNVYRNQSFCVDEQEMKHICFCRAFLEK